MMADSTRHSAVVAQWMERTAAGRPTRELVTLFGRALIAIWERAHVTLGEVSLEAIMNRVLFNGRARFPVLVTLGVEPRLDSFRALAAGRDTPIDGPALEPAARFVLTELLGLLGVLTGEVLSEPLYAALLAVEAAAHGERATAAGPPAPKNREERS